MKETKVINLFAQPGAGKSTTAAGLFHLMKLAGKSCELAFEYAKELVWSERGPMFEHQDYLFAKQHYKIRRLLGKVDYIITDSPLLLGLVYLPADYPSSFRTYVFDTFKRFENINYLITRAKPYDPVGRNQNEKESDALGAQIRNMLDFYKLAYVVVPGDNKASQTIYDQLFPSFNQSTLMTSVTGRWAENQWNASIKPIVGGDVTHLHGNYGPCTCPACMPDLAPFKYG